MTKPKSERHHCERCGADLDNGHEKGPLFDFNYLCGPCDSALMKEHPEMFPLMKEPTEKK